MEVHALHIKITMIPCLPNLLDDFTALRGSWGGTVPADVSIQEPTTTSFSHSASALSPSTKIIPQICPEI